MKHQQIWCKKGNFTFHAVKWDNSSCFYRSIIVIWQGKWISWPCFFNFNWLKRAEKVGLKETGRGKESKTGISHRDFFHSVKIKGNMIPFLLADQRFLMCLLLSKVLPCWTGYDWSEYHTPLVTSVNISSCQNYYETNIASS